MIPTHCAGCGKRFRVKPEYAGRHVKCPSCGQKLPHALPADALPRVKTRDPTSQVEVRSGATRVTMLVVRRSAERAMS